MTDAGEVNGLLDISRRAPGNDRCTWRGRVECHLGPMGHNSAATAR
jgi:hypothetical protein